MIRKSQLFSLVSLSIASLFASTQVFPGVPISKMQNYKNEVINIIPCPVGLMINDGLYMGVGLGYDSYRIGDAVGFSTASGNSATWDAILNPAGVNGGGFVGYGKYLNNFFDLYLGLEAFGLASSAKSSYELNANTPLLSSPAVLTTDIQAKANYGISMLPGIKLNTGSLLYLRLGYNWAKINVDQTLKDQSITRVDAGESTTTHGFNYGLGIETALYKMWSLRFEYNHTDYNSFETNLNTHISPADNQLLLGLIYHFNKQLPMLSGLTPCETLKQGFYFGVAAGYDAYRITENILITDNTMVATINPDLSANGAVGGGIFGYGKYFDNFYNTYLGLEIFGNGTQALVRSELSEQMAPSRTSNNVISKIKINSNYGVGLLPGIKLNEATLLYFRLGYNWAVVRSEEFFVSASGLSFDFNETKTVQGLNYGLGMEFATSNNNLSVRTEYTHTDYSSFNSGNLKISPENNQYMLGVIYHFV